MIQATVRDFARGKLDAINYEGHFIYIIRDREHVLYVGRSVDTVRRLYEHISPTSRIASDEIGDLIWENRPASLSWQIELLTISDCMPFVKAQYPLWKLDDCSMDMAEKVMIRLYHPSINKSNNPNPNPLPSHIKRQALEIGLTDNLY